MAILAIFTGKGMTKDMYDQLRAEVDWEHQQPKGAISHIASFDEAGEAHVVDIWNSPDDLNAFVTARLMPAFQKLNFPPPEVEVYPAHNINVFTTIEPYLV